jgi:hypothetical protein
MTKDLGGGAHSPVLSSYSTHSPPTVRNCVFSHYRAFLLYPGPTPILVLTILTKCKPVAVPCCPPAPKKRSTR